MLPSDNNEGLRNLRQQLNSIVNTTIPQEMAEDLEHLNKIICQGFEDDLVHMNQINLFGLVSAGDRFVEVAIAMTISTFITGAAMYRDLVGQIDPEMVRKVDAMIEARANQGDITDGKEETF